MVPVISEPDPSHHQNTFHTINIGCLHVCSNRIGCGSGGKWGEAKKWSTYKEMQVEILISSTKSYYGNMNY
jgi:hypothetical protein